MEIIHTIDWMKQIARQSRDEGRVIGFVPTMGALHEGHLSLVRAASQAASLKVVSIFVNPRQFGPAEDYSKYPRDLKADQEKLESLGVDVLFAPSAEEMYPPGFRTSVSVSGLGDRLEGRARPGHFSGVATVVLKLFEIVSPDLAFFGRKDAQQAQLVRQMVRDLSIATEIVVCPIVREAEGLALSSRNVYLSANERAAATVLYKALDAVRTRLNSGERSAAHLLATARAVLATEPPASTDYVEVVDADSFEPVTMVTKTCFVVIAARVGATRLIDNLMVEVLDSASTGPDPSDTNSASTPRVCCYL